MLYKLVISSQAHFGRQQNTHIEVKSLIVSGIAHYVPDTSLFLLPMAGAN